MDERFAYDELVFAGSVAEVHKVGLRTPDGTVVQRDLIRYGGAAVVLPVLPDGSIVMIRNYRFAVDERLLELPAGMIEDHEAPEACAVRELAEETGYAAARVEKLGQFYTSPGSTDELMHAYVATELTGGRQDLERYEQITTEAFWPQDVRRMILEGTIHDGKTIAALALYWMREPPASGAST